MAGRLMELFGILGTAVHQGIVATEALENEMTDAQRRAQELDDKNEQVKHLQVEISELSKEKAALEETITQLRAAKAAILEQFK